MYSKMAKISLAADQIQVRVSSIEENRAILREIQTKKEVDARKQDELRTLFDDINAESCVSKSLRERRKIFTPSSFDKIKSTLKTTVHYGPLPGCLPGKWWGIRVDCSKDRVHQPVNEKIDDGPYGAVSICTSNLNVHNDVDLGHVLTFTSREYNPTNEYTDSLILSYKNQVPVRLVRSSCLSNKYAPRTGYRYDGLYTVIHHWIGVAADTTRYHKFVLTRVLDQEPPPWINKKAHVRSTRLKKSASRLTRSLSSTSDRESKAIKFVYNKVEKNYKPSNVIAIVSRQVFDKCTSNSPDTTLKSTLNPDSAKPSLHVQSCSTTKLCNTNLSLRTNLYDSSHQAQDVKKTVTSACKILKSNQLSQVPYKEFKQLSNGASSKRHIESDTSATRTRSANSEEKAKKVTWADACNAGLIRMEKTIPTGGNGYQYGAVDGSGPRKKGRVIKYNNATGSCATSKMTKQHKRTSSTRTSDHAGQGHSKMNLSQNTKAHFPTVHELLHETKKSSESTSIDSLAPDELVSVIIKEKYHPMAKLLIGNMIGLENQEDALVNAYNALTRVNQDDSKQYKLRNKFSIKSPSKKNGILKKQRREIANLTIDAKFDTRSSRSRGLGGGTSSKRILKSESTRRKLLNTRRIQSRKKGIASRENNSKILEQSKCVQNTVKKVKKMVTVWTQCSLLAANVPTVDQCEQTEDLRIQTCSPGMKMEPVELDAHPSVTCNTASLACSDPATSYSTHREACSNYPGSAFAAVSADSNDRITRLRSIGFRPIGCDSPTRDVESGEDESSKQDVSEEYNKYTSEENDVVGYMDEQLHFQDIEEEEKMPIEGDGTSLQTVHSANILPQSIETLTEHDFNKPWHGWRKISINGQTYWTGC